MTDAELRDAAIAELKLTTAGWRKPNGQPNYPSGTAPATSHWGKAMKLLSQIADDAPPPPPPVLGDPYWEWKATNGKYDPLTTIFQAYGVDSHMSGGFMPASSYDTTLGDNGLIMARDPAQRVSLRTSPVNPNGTGWVSRQELRASDTAWQPSASDLDKSTIRNTQATALGGVGGFGFGKTAWFGWDYFLPLNYGPNNETFNWSSTWHCLMDLHGSGSAYEQNWNVLEADVNWGTHPKFVYYHIAAHEGSSDPAPSDLKHVPLLYLTDSGGNRVAASYNVWHELVVGVKFHWDGVVGNSTGWIELWHDGVNVLPRESRPTCFPNETGIWQQAQNYKSHSSALFGGASSSVIYYGGMRAGATLADVKRR